MATLCLLIGICYTLGFAALTVGRLNVLSITLVPILIGLAIDYGVHLIFRYEEQVRQGQTRRAAIAKAFGFTGLGVLTNALTIAGAFYIITLTNFKGMQEMGLIAGSGVIVCLIPMFTLLPLLLVRGKPDLRDPLATGSKRNPRDPLMISLRAAVHHPPAAPSTNNGWSGFEQLYLKHPWLVLLGSAIFTMFAILGAFKVEFDYNLLHLQSRDLPAVRLQGQLTRASSHSLLYCAVIAESSATGPGMGATHRSTSLRGARDLSSEISD
jgi:predicted RND superfamily exporter protein